MIALSARRTHLRTSVLALIFAMALVPASPVSAAPPDRAAALEAYLAMNDAKGIPAGWTGSVQGCVEGTESAASVDATARTVNTLRDFAGLAPVGFDGELNRKALAAALMMKAANALSHAPGPEWPCSTEHGREGANRSNLFLGRSGAAAMVGYVDDEGVDSLGHRRWLLDPRATTFGTGSTDTTNALLVVGTAGAAPVPELVAWPPAGDVPWPLIFRDWSAAISAPGTVDASGAVVSVLFDGQPRAVSGTTVLSNGAGTGTTLKWTVGMNATDPEGSQRIDVKIDNVLVDGVPRSYAYSLTTFPVLPPVAGRFDATRTDDAVRVTWAPATERGVPVSGYEITGTDGGSQFNRTVGPDVREVTVPYGERRTLTVKVVPLSRVGSPDVAPISVAAPPRRPSSGTTVVDRPGSRTTTTQRRSPARLSLKRMFIRGGRLVVTVGITRKANGQAVRVKLRGGGRTVWHRARVRSGKASFNIALNRRHRRSRPLRVTVSFKGTAAVLPSSTTRTFRR